MNQPMLYDELLTEYKSQLVKYNTLIDTSPDGIMILKSIRDESGKIVDFLISTCNRAATTLGHFPVDAESKTMLTVLPHLKSSEQFDMHKQVVETGEPTQFDTNFRDENGRQYGWFIVSLMKLEDGVYSRFIDISSKKEYEKKIEDQAIFYNGILEASINGVFVCEAIKNGEGKIEDFTIIKVNKAFREMTGKSSVDVDGISYFSLFPQSDDIMFYLFCKVIETRKAIRLEFQYPLNSGFWYDVSIGWLNETAIVITFTDISEQKKAFIEVEQKNKLLTNILSHSPSGISVTEIIRDESGNVTDGKTILANDISSLFTGMSKERFQQLTFKQIEPELNASKLFKKSVETLLTGKSFRMQIQYKVTGRWLEIGVSKMDNNHLVNIFSDVTERKESQLKLENLVKELKQTNANLEEFTYAASHDLKEPIRKVRIFAERLKTKHGLVLDSDGAVLLNKLLDAGMRMQLLVDDLLEYSKINNSYTGIEEINLHEMLKWVLIDLDLAIEEKQAKIKVENLPVVKGYGRQIQQMFQNLISNSLKYSKEGIPPQINISSSKVKGSSMNLDIASERANKYFFQVKIEDNGIGFEQKDADKIFRVFHRLHERNEFQGTGIGLSIVKRVIENHHGYIMAHGEPGMGAVFNIYLPED